VSVAARAGWRDRLHGAAPFGAAALVAFSAAAVGAGLGRALVTTYLPVLLARIRDAPGLIGTVMLVNTIAGLLVPLVVGAWSDRLRVRGHGRTVPFVLGGTVVAAGGLAAIALGSTTSYVALALFAAVTYVGLNAVTTAHRALIPENFSEDERGAATGGEEVAMLGGTLAGVALGGLLVEAAAWAPFALGAALLPILCVPTVRRMRHRERPVPPRPPHRLGARYYATAAIRPGGRLILSAQALWVMGYVGLPPFFVLYAARELELGPGPAGLVLAAFGIVTGLAMVAAGAVRPERQRALLVVGAVLMGTGLLAVAAGSTVAVVAPALVPVAAGFGVLTTLGFPVYSAFIPRGEEGAYSALYFSVRSIASAVAVPAAGWTIALSDSYRALFVLGGMVTLAAVVPLLRLATGPLPWRVPRRITSAAGRVAVATALLLAGGLVVDRTALLDADEAMFDLVRGSGWTPAAVDALLVDPHIQNYAVLTLLAGLAARRWRPGQALRTAAVVAAAAICAYLPVRAMWAVWDRQRPQEALGIDPANAHDWSPYASFPSGHVAVTTAIVAAASILLPRLHVPLWSYAGVIAVTRITAGAHFPSDVAAGLVIGLVAASATLTAAGFVDADQPSGWWRALRDARRVRALAVASSLAALAVFGLLLLTEGPPASPEGGVLSAGLQHDLQVALLALAAASAAAAARWPAFGVLLMLVGALLGVLAAVEYTPWFAVLACLALLVPGVLFLLSAPRARTPAGASAIGALVTAVLWLGAVAAFALHDAVFGPAHPQSARSAPPTWRVAWAWSGGVTADAVTVKAKLQEDGRARLVVSADPALRSPATSRSSVAGERNGRIVSLTVRGLEPRTRYFYGVEVDGRIDPYRRGRFTTFDERPLSFSFAFSSCARVGSNGEVFEAIRREDPLFFMVLGDFFYANIDENERGRFLEQYDTALGQPAQDALYRSTSVAYVWDDHDFGGDGSDSRSPSRSAARWAYGTAVPHHPLRGGPAGAINQAFTVGRVRFLLLDTRSARDPRRRPRPTMLGDAQRSWLKRELLAARRFPLVVIVNPVPWIAPASIGSDTWGGYAAERAELSRFVARHRPRGLLMLSADAHMLAIDDGSHSDFSGTGRAGFPVMHAAALDRGGRVKGGPYSEGTVPGAGQYGLVHVSDRGRELAVALSGRDHRRRELIAHRFTVGAPPG
jgi:membrane-associated phospholipid phosphatase/MFS family permease